MLFYSGNAFITEYLKHLYAGYEAQTVFTFTPHGNTIFHKMVVLIDQVKIPALELALNLKGEKSLFIQLQEVFAEVFNLPVKSNDAVWNALHAEWQKIVKDMKFEALRSKKKLEGEINELEIALDHANKANSEGMKTVK